MSPYSCSACNGSRARFLTHGIESVGCCTVSSRILYRTWISLYDMQSGAVLLYMPSLLQYRTSGRKSSQLLLLTVEYMAGQCAYGKFAAVSKSSTCTEVSRRSTRDKIGLLKCACKPAGVCA